MASPSEPPNTSGCDECIIDRIDASSGPSGIRGNEKPSGLRSPPAANIINPAPLPRRARARSWTTDEESTGEWRSGPPGHRTTGQRGGVGGDKLCLEIVKTIIKHTLVQYTINTR